MEYIIIPTEVFEQADMELAKKLGLDNPRKSIDGSEVIMHVECYDRLFLFGQTPSPQRKARNVASYQVYDSNSDEFNELLSSEAWSMPEDEPMPEDEIQQQQIASES